MTGMEATSVRAYWSIGTLILGNFLFIPDPRLPRQPLLYHRPVLFFRGCFLRRATPLTKKSVERLLDCSIFWLENVKPLQTAGPTAAARKS